LKRSSLGFGAASQTGFLQGLGTAIAKVDKVRDFHDAIANVRQVCTPRKRTAGILSIPAVLENYQLFPISQCHGRGAGVGRGLGVGAGLGVGETLGVIVAVGVADADAVAVGVAVAVAVAVGVGDGLAQGGTSYVRETFVGGLPPTGMQKSWVKKPEVSSF